jgi:hypothetical protein
MEKGAMAAVVLDHEKPHQKARGWHRKQQAQPIAEIKGYPHQNPKRDQRPGRDDELEDAAHGIRDAIARQDRCEVAGLDRN